MIVRQSALKHGIREDDAIAAASWPLIAAPLDDEDPQRFLRVGFDTQGLLLEVVVAVWDDGTEELIHAMKCRPKYLGMLG